MGILKLNILKKKMVGISNVVAGLLLLCNIVFLLFAIVSEECNFPNFHAKDGEDIFLQNIGIRP
jgi:hypothetical protein